MKRFMALVALVLVIGLYVWWYRGNANPDIHMPASVAPSPNAFDTFNAAASLVRDKKIFSPPSHISYITLPEAGQLGSLPWATPAQEEQVTRDNAAALSQLRVGFQYKYLSPPCRSYDTPIGYYAKYRTMVSLLKYEGRAAALRRDWYVAASDDVDAMLLGNKCPNGGPFIGALVSYACSSEGRYDVWPAIDHLDAQQATLIAHRIQAMQQRRIPFWNNVQEDKWGFQAALLAIFSQKNGLQTFLSTYGNAKLRYSSDQIFYMKYPKRTTMKLYTDYMDSMIAKYKQPYFNTARLPSPPIPHDILCEMVIPDLAKGRFRDVWDNANTQLLMTAVALRAYELDHAGTYPPYLTGLVPKYLNAVPYDPFARDNAALKYRRVGSSYLLYSVGADGIDDGGKPFFNREHKPPTSRWEFADTKGDIVAGINIG